MSTQQPKYTYTPPAAILPEQWLSGVTASAASRTCRHTALALAWLADRHGNPLSMFSHGHSVMSLVVATSARTFDMRTLNRSIASLERDGWIACTRSTDKQGRRWIDAVELTMPGVRRSA